MTKELNEKLGTTGVEWNLNDLYDGTDDQKVRNDIDECERLSEKIENQYAGKVAGLNAGELLELVTRLEGLSTRLGRVATFAYLNFATRTKDAAASAFLQEIREIASRIGKKTVFFELEWTKADEPTALALLASKELAHYRHYLASMRRYADHLLSQSEETLLLEIAPAGRSSWTNLFDKVMGHLKFGEKGRTEEEVLSDLYDADRAVRRQAADELTAGLRSQQHILTHIFNTLLADKMIDDRIRSYGSWLSSMNLYNELNDNTVTALISAVTERYDIPQRYYRIKRDLLGLDELTDYDRYAPLPHLPDTKIPWQQCRDVVLEAFATFSPQMAEIAAQFFDRRWIHAPLVEGKRGGAFAHPCVPDAHPYVMVNYTGTLRDVSTVAHELGHGVHQHLAAAQGYYNSSTTLVLAETASVFGELLLFSHQHKLIADERQRRAFVCQKLESIFATVFRQVSMNRFEDRVHSERRRKGELAVEEISSHWLETQRAMFGNSVTLRDDYGIWWSYIPHFLSTPGYVYSYAFGELLVLSLFKIYQDEGASFVPKYVKLLESGGSNTPYELVKPFGVNLDDPVFWHGGLVIMEEMLQSVDWQHE